MGKKRSRDEVDASAAASANKKAKSDSSSEEQKPINPKKQAFKEKAKAGKAELKAKKKAKKEEERLATQAEKLLTSTSNGTNGVNGEAAIETEAPSIQPLVENGVDEVADKKKSKKDKKDKKEKKEKNRKSKLESEPTVGSIAEPYPTEQSDTVMVDVEAEVVDTAATKTEKRKKKKDKRHSKVEQDEDVPFVVDRDGEPAISPISTKVAPTPVKSDSDPNVQAAKVQHKAEKKLRQKREKQAKAAAVAAVDSKPNSRGKTTNEAEETLKKQHRFIVFIGNLPFTATKESISEHFKALQPTSIRAPTKKESPNSESKGFAFLEFDRYDHMKSCLSLYHHSKFDDGKSPSRRINVELTAGGGGNNAARQDKLKVKNDKLKEERKKKHEQKDGDDQKAKDVAEEVNQEPTGDGMHPSRRARLGAFAR